MDTILLIDDETMVARPMVVGLKAAGYEVNQVENGKQGLEQALSQHPKLIILDYQMPDMDGLTLLKKLREDEWGKTAQVIFATNIYELEIVNQAMNLGVRDYILKSEMNLDDIVKLVGSYMQA